VAERKAIAGVLAEARARIDGLDPSAARSAQESGALLIDTRCTELPHETGMGSDRRTAREDFSRAST
jgi:hypothetical protein